MDSDFVFLAAIPAGLALALVVARSRFRLQVAVTFATGTLLLLSRIPWDRQPATSDWRSFAGGALLVTAPFAGVLLCQVLFRRQFEEHPARLLFAIPISYWLGLIILGIQLGMTLGLIRP